MTSGSKWDGGDGEEGGDEDVEQEEELGGKITIIIKGGCNFFFVVVFDFQFITSLYFSIFLWSRYLIVALLKSFLLMC